MSFTVPIAPSASTVDLALLVVELILLVSTFTVIVLNRKEEKVRESVVEKMLHTARIVSRQEYFNSVIFGIQGSSKEILGSITGSKPNSEMLEQVNRIAQELKRASDKGVRIRYLVPKSIDRLKVACIYESAGAEVRFHPGLLVMDIRYMIVDGNHVVLGLPGEKGENNPTREGYLVPSNGLADMFIEIFERRWKEATLCDNYIKEIVNELKLHNANITPSKLSSELEVPETKILEIVPLN
ncbi:MAG: phospholipase D family protein [Candidatus Thermoplasmatota archaeon]|nr:phospholipase D family protein [Candidatus Thermoplasmatota archaeon]MCL5681280.1 phospholipase D family protein [Candidatus Thermoplasmatota archaeon]